ncbi:hypothetical protein [Bernardetia sp. MNP-M8]|uniref:hypothetical protein n=1 Tax=Bernardetia sp. MNP-M8 TaxID=3127470 RepID=UPI0030D34482
MEKLLKTVYFTGIGAISQIDEVIKKATDKRDEFIELNSDEIAKVIQEDIIPVTYHQNQSHTYITIKLSYYPK